MTAMQVESNEGEVENENSVSFTEDVGIIARQIIVVQIGIDKYQCRCPVPRLVLNRRIHVSELAIRLWEFDPTSWTSAFITGY